jgi:hypothetical protein
VGDSRPSYSGACRARLRVWLGRWEAQRIVAFRICGEHAQEIFAFSASNAARWKGVARWKWSIPAVAVWTCIRRASPLVCCGPRPRGKEKRSFGTFTHDLLRLADWLQECGVTHVAMESTGGYWKPVWNILAEQFEVLLVKAQHSKAVPAGRRTRKTASGWRTCCSMDYSGGVSCLHDRHANSATSRGIG